MPRAFGVISRGQKTERATVLLTDSYSNARYVSFLNVKHPSLATSFGTTVSFLGLTTRPSQDKRTSSNLVAADLRPDIPYIEARKGFLEREAGEISFPNPTPQKILSLSSLSTPVPPPSLRKISTLAPPPLQKLQTLS